MENNKDIGSAYKEALENFSVSPHNRVWENIEKHLDKPKRRMFPFWKMATGLVILIPLLFYITKIQMKSGPDPTHSETPIITNEEIDKTIADQNQDHLKNDDSHVKKSDSVINGPNRNSTNDHLKMDVSPKYPETQANLNSNNTNAVSTSSENDDATNSANQAPYKYSHAQSHNTDKQYADGNAKRDILYNNRIHDNQEKNLLGENKKMQLKSRGVVTFEHPIIGSFEFKDMASTKPKKKIIKKDDGKGLTVKVYGGPTYFNTLSKKSMLSEFLDDNKKQSNIRSSYGISASFELTKRSSISFGVARIDLAQTTVSADSLRNIGNELFLNNSTSFEYLDRNNQSRNMTALSSLLVDNETALDFRQEISYLEIPIGYSYALVEGHKLRLDVNGGVSFLTLIENRIIAESPNGNSLNIGKANNLNKLNLNINMGASLSYPISKRFSIFTEPVFKYYLKTINRNNGFKPYSLGLNFGVLYKF